MSKSGKIIGVAAFVLALAAAVLAFFELKQAKAHAGRYAELAQAVGAAAKTLDSGSGNAAKLAFSVDEKGKEQGALGWESTKGLAGATDSAAAPLKTLAGQLIDQREYLINNLIDQVAKTLECPADKQPDMDAVSSLPEYEGSLDKFNGFVKARANRDAQVANRVNQVLRVLNVRGTYKGVVTENGSLAQNDAQAFADGAKNLGNLQGNYQLMVQTLRDLSSTLRSAQVSGVQWVSPKAAGSLGGTGLTEGENSSNKDAVAQFRNDFETLKAQLGRIDLLENDKLDLQEEIAELKEKLAEAKAMYEQDEEVLRSYYRQGLGMNYTTTDKELKTSYDQVKTDLSGNVLKTDAKYGYVVVNLTECEVIPELRLAVYRNGRYLALLRVLATTPFNSLTVVEDGTIASIAAGDTVVVGGRALQPAEF